MSLNLDAGSVHTQTLLEKLKTLYSDFEGLPPDRIVPTVGLNIGRIEAHKSKLIFWDLGGQVIFVRSFDFGQSLLSMWIYMFCGTYTGLCTSGCPALAIPSADGTFIQFMSEFNLH